MSTPSNMRSASEAEIGNNKNMTKFGEDSEVSTENDNGFWASFCNPFCASPEGSNGIA
jgi:hypothetical protein